MSRLRFDADRDDRPDLLAIGDPDRETALLPVNDHDNLCGSVRKRTGFRQDHPVPSNMRRCEHAPIDTQSQIDGRRVTATEFRNG